MFENVRNIVYLAFQLYRNVSDTSGPKSIPMEGISGPSDGGGGIEGGESDGRTGSVDGDAVFNGVVIGLAVTLLIMILALAVRTKKISSPLCMKLFYLKDSSKINSLECKSSSLTE